ncbi:MAG TPA: DNA polymerase domain-containing protein [Bacteroidales bacterium]|nr:DNA polymerase domain-containing protein [Bacteroidales bacterium]
MYTNVFVDKKENVVHLWDDTKGYKTFPYRRYAYRRAPDGEYISLYGDKLEKVFSFDEYDPTLFESDVSPEMRVLIDQYEDSDEPSVGHRILVLDIEVSSEGGFPDITKGDKAITAIALFDQAGNKYYSLVLDPENKISSKSTSELETCSFKSEDTLLNSFLNLWEQIQPTIVTGWNSNNFDIPYLYNRIRAVLGKQASYRLSPIGIMYQNKFSGRMVCAGISLLDYLELYKKFIGVMKPSWSLANIAKDEELKHQKLTYKGSLTELYKKDILRYVEYNLVDVKVVVELDQKYDFIRLAQAVCHKGHVPYEWFQMSSRFIDGAILMYLRRNGKVAPNKPIGGREEYESMQREDEEGFTGAFVKEPISGLYDWICSADITSLYPSVIMSLNISPESKIGKIEGWNMMEFQRGNISTIQIDGRGFSAEDFKKKIANYAWSISSNGVVYRQDIRGVVPTVLDVWFKERLEYRKLQKKFSDEGDKVQSEFYKRRQLRQKIFLNSVYGTLGLPVFRFYDRDNAEAVTISGQEIIRSAEKLVNDMYYAKFKEANVLPSQKDYVVYIDTDSLYMSALPVANLLKVKSEHMTKFTIDWVTEVAAKINRFYEYMIPKIFNVAPEHNRIKIVPDVIAKKALWVVKKRYAMLKVYDMETMKEVKDKNGNEGKLEVKGIDVVRSSFPAAFRKFSSDMLDALLRGVPQKELDERILSFEENIDKISVSDLAKTSSVRFISRNGNDDYNPSHRKLFQYINKSPAQVRAALAYNDLLKVWKLNRQYEKITHSEKIKWVYLLPNDFYIESLAIKGDDTDPDEILNFISMYVDRKKMYERELKSKLSEIYSCIGWKYPNRGSQLATQTFDFNETW